MRLLNPCLWCVWRPLEESLGKTTTSQKLRNTSSQLVDFWITLDLSAAKLTGNCYVQTRRV